MSSLAVFEFKSNQVRVIEVNGEPWFVAKDVCDVLEISNNRDAISRLDDDEKGVATTDTLGGNQEMVTVSESGLYSLVLTSRKPEAKVFKKWLTSEVLPSIRKTGSYSVPLPQVKPRLPQEVTDNTLEVHGKLIAQFENSGDLQLAQLLKSRLGNLILAEQQNLLKPVEVQQYEGAVQIALRLGYSVPPNFEGTLGKEVRKRCGHLILGQNQRYSTASHQQVAANMYPANNAEVEAAVIEYCVSRSFRHRDINLLG